MHPVRRFFRLLALDKRDIGYVYLYALFTGLITLTLPLGVQAIIGLISGGNFSGSWGLLILVVTIGTALTGVLTMMQLTVTETLRQRIFTRTAFDFAYRLPRMQFESIHRQYPPELVNRFFDTMTLQKSLPKILIDFSTGILQTFFGLVLLAFYHPFFIIFGLLLAGVVWLIFHFTGPRGLATSLSESKYKYEVASWLEEIARSMITFKLASKSALPLQRTDDLVNKYLDARKSHFRILMLQYGSLVAFKTLVTAGLLVLGSFLVIDNRINLGQFVAAEIVVILIIASIEKLILTMEIIYDMLTALDKIGVLTDIPLEKDSGISAFPAPQGIGIELKNIRFQFGDDTRPTLDGLHLSIRPGEKICVAGYNGSGKSTLLQVIIGLYKEYTGSLTFDGIPASNLNLAELRAHIGENLHHQDIFKGTMLENLTMGYENVSMNEVLEAVNLVGLSEFINHLPEGYHTLLIPQGLHLPSSIVTKIKMARCFISKPSLITIEESFAFLEKEDRIQLIDCLTDKKSPWTLIAVTDDPFFAARCDRIVIMDAGKIVAEGNFESLKKTDHFTNVFKH